MVASKWHLVDSYGLERGDCLTSWGNFGYSFYYTFQSYGSLCAGLKIFQYNGNLRRENIPINEYFDNYKFKFFIAITPDVELYLFRSLSEIKDP